MLYYIMLYYASNILKFISIPIDIQNIQDWLWIITAIDEKSCRKNHDIFSLERERERENRAYICCSVVWFVVAVPSSTLPPSLDRSHAFLIEFSYSLLQFFIFMPKFDSLWIMMKTLWTKNTNGQFGKWFFSPLKNMYSLWNDIEYSTFITQSKKF